MTEEPLDSQVEAFKLAWEEAHAKGLYGSRVKAGLTAVFSLPKTDHDRELLERGWDEGFEYAEEQADGFTGVSNWPKNNPYRS